MNYFRHYWEQPDDSGAAVADEPDETQIDEPEVEEVETEPEESYTRAQLAELLGPRFERFASHEGEEAFRQFGSAYDSATGLIRQGAHLEPQDASVYEQIGLDPGEVYQPEPEPAPGLFGVPWEAPTTWDEVQAYANSEDPSARRLAAMAVMNEPTAPEDVKRAYFNHWAAIDPAGATLYNQQAMQAEFDRRLAERDAAWEERFGAVHGDLENRNAADLMETVKAQVPGFEQHASGVLAIWNEYNDRTPGYRDWFLKAPRGDQVKEMRRLTTLAAAEAAPEREAAKAASQQETTSAKLRARTETSRTNGAPEDSVDESTRQRREAMRRVGARIT